MTEQELVIEHKFAYVQRREVLNKRMEVNNINVKLLAKHTKIGQATIQGYCDGSIVIQKPSTFEALMKWIDYIIKNELNVHNKSVVDKYIVQHLHEYGNVFINKSKRKYLDEILKHVKSYGYDCRVVLVEEGHFILEDKKIFKLQFAQGSLLL